MYFSFFIIKFKYKNFFLTNNIKLFVLLKHNKLLFSAKINIISLKFRFNNFNNKNVKYLSKQYYYEI